MVTRRAQKKGPGDKDRASSSSRSTEGPFGFQSAMSANDTRKPCCPRPSWNCMCHTSQVDTKKGGSRNSSNDSHIPMFSRLREPKIRTKEEIYWEEMRKSIEASRGPPYGVGSIDNPFGVTTWKGEKKGNTLFSEVSSSADGKQTGLSQNNTHIDTSRTAPSRAGPTCNPFGMTPWKRENSNAPFSSFTYGKQDASIPAEPPQNVNVMADSKTSQAVAGSNRNPFGMTAWKSEKMKTRFFNASFVHGNRDTTIQAETSRKLNGIVASKTPTHRAGANDNPFAMAPGKNEKARTPFFNAASSFPHGKQDTSKFIQAGLSEKFKFGETWREKEKKPYIFTAPTEWAREMSKPKKTSKVRSSIHLPPSMLYPPKYMKDPLGEFDRGTGTPFDDKTERMKAMNTKAIASRTKQTRAKNDVSRWDSLGNGRKMPEIEDLIRVSESVNGIYKEIDDLSSMIDTIIARLRTG